MSSSALVNAHHVGRMAVVYIRQSTEQQVLNNVESRRLQHAMRERAQQLGWNEDRISVVETDTGITAKSTTRRYAYQRLLSDVAEGKVGVVISYESARLSRNCSDWYPLLDACAAAHCLIADRDGVYDPATPNGRLLLGMKGILSEVELHTLQGRLLAGRQQKARRGELAVLLPAGLERIEGGRVIKDPDLRVQKFIELVFEQFLHRRSATQVARTLRQEQLMMPCRQPHGDVVWKEVNRVRISLVLQNPAYAGAFVYGRRKQVKEGSGLVARNKKVEMAQWEIMVRDCYPSYISWETFEQIQEVMKDNYAEYRRRKSRGVPRDGSALLAGIVYCGECGHKMMVAYKGGSRYVCNYEQRQQPSAAVCQNLHAEAIDKTVAEIFFSALAPCELDVYEQAMAQRHDRQREYREQRQRDLERLRYEADLARRQYDRVDPDNRLVASELERRWEAALRALRDTEEAYEAFDAEKDKVVPFCISTDLREAFTDVGKSLPHLWETGTFREAQKKALLRCLIDKVILHRPPDHRDRVHSRIVWRGGLATTADIVVPVNALRELPHYAEMEKRLLELEAAGGSDAAIAEDLNREGFVCMMDKPIDAQFVKRIRLKHRRLRPPNPEGTLSIPSLARRMGIHVSWFYRNIKQGRIQIAKNPSTGTYLFQDEPKTYRDLLKLRESHLRKVCMQRGY
jgi:DNA invertase Pin-like site-specific DNA recombinase